MRRTFRFRPYLRRAAVKATDFYCFVCSLGFSYINDSTRREIYVHFNCAINFFLKILEKYREFYKNQEKSTNYITL